MSNVEATTTPAAPRLSTSLDFVSESVLASDEQSRLNSSPNGQNAIRHAMLWLPRVTFLGRRACASMLVAAAVWLLLGVLGGTRLAQADAKSPYAAEAAEIKGNLKGFPGLKKIAIVGVVEVLEDLRSGKQEFLYQKIPSQKLALRFSYFIPAGFTVQNRSAADVDAMLKNAGLGMGELLNFSQVPVLGQAYGADALLVGAYYSSTRNGFDVDVQSAVFVKLIDVKTGALIWTKELDKKELQVPGNYNRPTASTTPPGVRP